MAPEISYFNYEPGSTKVAFYHDGSGDDDDDGDDDDYGDDDDDDYGGHEEISTMNRASQRLL